MKKNNKKGFTLAELLIVVAIIGVLVAVSIPIFTSQLAKSRLATNQANARAAYAAATAAYLNDDTVKGGTYTTSDGKFVAGTPTGTDVTNTDIASWTTTDMGTTTYKTWGVVLDNNGSVTKYTHE